MAHATSHPVRRALAYFRGDTGKIVANFVMVALLLLVSNRAVVTVR